MLPTTKTKKSKANPGDLKAFIEGYLEAARWSSSDEEGVPFDDSKYSDVPWSDEAVQKATRDAADFIAANGANLDKTGAPYSRHGHDFFLTRNGHGAGFWDRGYGELGQHLTDRAHGYGEAYVYAGDDGKLHIG